MGEMIYPKRLSGPVRKASSFAALTLLTGLLLSGCSGAPAVTPTADPVSTNSSTPEPKLNAVQRTSLIAELQKIDPALGTQRTVATARQGCRMILNGDSEENQLAFAMKALSTANIKPDATSADKAKKIIDVIKSNGFCKA
jgi:hypothetical protein